MIFMLCYLSWSVVSSTDGNDDDGNDDDDYDDGDGKDDNNNNDDVYINLVHMSSHLIYAILHSLILT